MGQKKHHHSSDNFGTCCRFRSAARKNTRFIQSGAAKPAPRLCALETNCDAESGRRTDGPEETPSTVARWVRKNTIIPATTLVATKVHAAHSEARPEKTHASFKVVLPNLRHGCALWRQIAMQKADAAPMGQKKHHPCGVRTRSPATTRSPAKRNNWIAAMHLLKAKTICFRCTETSFSQFHFGMHPLRIIMFTVFPEPQIRTAFLLGVRPHPNGPRAVFLQNLQDKNSIRSNEMLPQAQPQRYTFTKSVQQIYCVLGRCICPGQTPVRRGRAARARKTAVPVPSTSPPLLRCNAGRELLIRHGCDSGGQKNHCCCCCAIVRSEQTHTLATTSTGTRLTLQLQACNEMRLLPRDYVQWITAAAASSCMQWIKATAAPSCGQKKHTRWPRH